MIVRERDLACVLCGDRETLTCGHLFSRVAYSTRWDLDNCFAQCLSCNLKHEYKPYNFFKWYINKFGQEKLDELDKKHNTIRKWKDFELEEFYEKLKNAR